MLLNRNIGRIHAFPWMCVVALWVLCMPPIASAQVRELFSLFSKSKLQEAIDKGLKPDGDLASELSKLNDYEPESQKDATAICRALKTMPQPVDKRSKQAYSLPEYELAVLFQNLNDTDSAAFPILRNEGIPELIRIYREMLKLNDRESRDAALFILKILAMYGTKDGTDTIIQAAKQSCAADKYLWSVILGQYDAEHPHSIHLFQSLADSLPVDFAGVCLLDAANTALREGLKTRHPFDSKQGVDRLRQWITSRDREEFSYAHSAAAAIPFLDKSSRERLLPLALEHVDPSVQMESAWAAAKLGEPAGVARLKKFCLDVRHSQSAQQYLSELDKESEIPAECKSPRFRALADFSAWLQHPNELGRAPDELTIYDERTLPWPVDGKRKQVWLIRFFAKGADELDEDDAGIGMVGSMTWCFFDESMLGLGAEDCYAIHCCWECEANEKTSEPDLTESQQKQLLDQWTGDPLSDVRLTRVLGLSAGLKYPQRVVGIAEAKRQQQDGYVVLDGPRSRWYAKSDLPTDLGAQMVLKIHVGRQLLGFPLDVDRGQYLKQMPKPDTSKLIVAYEKLLGELESAEVKRRIKILEGRGVSVRFDDYLDAKVAAQQGERDDLFLQTYERVFKATLRLPAEHLQGEDDQLDDGLVQSRFEEYVKILVERQQQQKLQKLIPVLEPHWDHNLGRMLLGGAALATGDNKTAIRLLEPLQEELPDFHARDDSDKLAEAWHRDGKVNESKRLLIDSIKKCAEEEKVAPIEEKAELQAALKAHHATLQKLFPKDFRAILSSEGIPSP